MTAKILKAKIITVCARCSETAKQDTFDAYKFGNGFVMIGTDTFLESTAELQQWGDCSTIVSIEETGEEASFTEEELLELFLAELHEQGSFNMPIKDFLRLLLLEHSS